VNGKLNRKNGPAYEHVNGDKQWYVNDKLHRINGAAVELANGEKYYFINNELLTKIAFDRKVAQITENYA